MSELPSVPPGPLDSVQRTWDYKAGWVRAPLKQIVCNKSLSKQARLLWLWLASIRPGDKSCTWGDCEAALGCQTKARKNCIAQLVSHGFIEIKGNGVVVLKDPYQAFENDSLSCDSIIVTENELEPQQESKQDESIDHIDQAEQQKNSTSTVKKTPKEKKSDQQEQTAEVIKAWNEYKPDSYRKLRVVSVKQLEAFTKHVKNLKQDPSDIDAFIKTICEGIKKSDFWMNTVNSDGRNFSAIFGYGSTQDKKLKNVEALFELGSGTTNPVAKNKTMIMNKEEIDAYETIQYNLQRARLQGNVKEIERWNSYLVAAEYQLTQCGIDISSL